MNTDVIVQKLRAYQLHKGMGLSPMQASDSSLAMMACVDYLLGKQKSRQNDTWSNYPLFDLSTLTNRAKECGVDTSASVQVFYPFCSSDTSRPSSAKEVQPWIPFKSRDVRTVRKDAEREQVAFIKTCKQRADLAGD